MVGVVRLVGHFIPTHGNCQMSEGVQVDSFHKRVGSAPPTPPAPPQHAASDRPGPAITTREIKVKLETGDRIAATLDEISGTLAAIVDTQCRIADALEKLVGVTLPGVTATPEPEVSAATVAPPSTVDTPEPDPATPAQWGEFWRQQVAEARRDVGRQ